jgi:phage terminase Nu1 subunit (DNA packaging protein)
MLTADLSRQQLCAALAISESTVRRLELDGLPYTPIGRRGKRYNLDEVKRWLREHQCQSGSTRTDAATSRSWSAGAAYTDACRRAHLRVMPSS